MIKKEKKRKRFGWTHCDLLPIYTYSNQDATVFGVRFPSRILLFDTKADHVKPTEPIPSCVQPREYQNQRSINPIKPIPWNRDTSNFPSIDLQLSTVGKPVLTRPRGQQNPGIISKASSVSSKSDHLWQQVRFRSTKPQNRFNRKFELAREIKENHGLTMIEFRLSFTWSIHDNRKVKTRFGSK